MENEQNGGNCPEPLNYKTWALRVSIHCVGCKKKVKKVLQSIEGVYKIEIDSKLHRVIVAGNVEAETLIKKLVKSGKQAKIWSENSENQQAENPVMENGCGNENGQPEKEAGDTSGDDHGEDKGGAPPQAATQSGGGGGAGGKKKKKKKKKKGNSGPPNDGGGGGGGGAPPPESGGAPPPAGSGDQPVDQMKYNHPHQQIFSYPSFYHAAPEYGMSYNNAPPNASMTSTYYTLPMHSYTYSSPHYYLPPMLSDPIIDVNPHDYYRGDDESGCSIM